MQGIGFPNEPGTEYYCRVGNSDAAPYLWVVTRAVVYNSTNIKCLDIHQFDETEIDVETELTIQFAYNPRDFTGMTKIKYYPKIKMTNLNNYTYWMTGDRLSIKITGNNFINTATKLTCRLTLSELEAEYFESAFVHFEDTEEIVCIFDIEPSTQPGMYYISVSNNDYQFVRLTKELELIPTVKIVNAWPNYFLMSDFTDDQLSHKIFIETMGLPF